MATQVLTGAITNAMSKITTYGAILLPPDFDKSEDENSVKADPKEKTSFMGKVKSAFSKAGDSVKNAVKHPGETFKKLGNYMKDNRLKIQGVMTTIGSKFSGIAVAQALSDGHVTTREALDYLFMGFAPALGIQGSLMGYSGLNQMKEALFDGSIDVGAFVNGFTRTLKGVTDFKDMITHRNTRSSKDIIEIDLTRSHSETYQSEVADRRVQLGMSLNEYCHNMPITFDIQCALQDGKRYSVPEFRAIMEMIRDKKKPVQLVLGDELFDSIMLTSFQPNNDCSKSGMDYTLSFKKIIQSDVDTNTEVKIVPRPETFDEDTTQTTTTGGRSGKVGRLSTSGGKSGSIKTPRMGNVDPLGDAAKVASRSVKKLKADAKGRSLAKLLNKYLKH